MKTFPIRAIFLVLACWLLPVAASANPQVEQILAGGNAPEGVVFEIATADPAFLEQAIPQVQRYSTQLRARFPDLPISVVTHGREQFALTKTNADANQSVHKGVQSLVKNSGITVHVCETYANRKGIDAEAFPDYINVSAEGPAQVNDYRQLGYTVILLSNKP